MGMEYAYIAAVYVLAEDTVVCAEPRFILLEIHPGEHLTKSYIGLWFFNSGAYARCETRQIKMLKPLMRRTVVQ